MKRLLEARLTPEHIEIIDESAQHAGHAGAAPGGETHFRLVIVAQAFQGHSRIARHRLVNETLQGLLATRIHALSLRLLTPEED